MTGGVLAVVVSYETLECTVACVASLLEEAERLDRPLRVVVVDNASADGTADAVRTGFEERVTLLANPRNAGYGAACNQGAAVDPEAEYVLFMNADIEVLPGALAPLVTALEEDATLGVVAPALEDDDRETRHSVRGHPTPLALLHQHTALRFLRFGAASYERYKRPHVGEDGRVAVLNGAALLLRGTDVRALSGFEPRYFLYFEEADLCRRVGERGLGCRLIPEAVFRHAGGASSGAIRDRALVWYLRSLFVYVDRFHGRTFGLLYRAVFKPLFLMRMLTDALRDILVLTFRGSRGAEKRAEVRLAARFFTRGMWTFLGS